MVVDDICQVVCRQIVGTLVEHLVVEDGRVDDHIAADHVVDMDILAGFNLEAHGIGRAGLDESLCLLFAEAEAVAHGEACGGVVLEVFHLLALCIQFFGCVEGDVCPSVVEELVDILAVDVAAFALAVRAVFATEGHTFIKTDAEPFEGFDDIIFGTGYKSLGVGVFDAEYKFAAMLACKEIVVECGAYAADVEGARRARCKPYADFL